MIRPERSKGRKLRAPRCEGCRLFPDICLCPYLPRVRLDTRILLLLHRGEAWKPSNTGRLGCRMLERQEVAIWSSRTAEPEPAPQWPQSEDGLLLFPGPESVPLDLLGRTRAGATLIVPDGTWAQVQRVVHGTPALARYRRVTLPQGVGPRFSPRRETRDGGMSTLDAMLFALAVLEGAEAVAPLEEAFAWWFERLQAMRGTPIHPERHIGVLRACAARGEHPAQAGREALPS